MKKKIFDWIIELKLIKKDAISINDLPDLVRNGIFLCDLINRFEMVFIYFIKKNCVIKGVSTQIYCRSQRLNNINRVLSYLEKFEKFNPRHLWNSKKIENGDKIVIWEFLYDIYTFFNKTFIKSLPKNKTSRSSSKKPNKYSILTPEYQTDEYVLKVNSTGTPSVKSKIDSIIPLEKQYSDKISLIPLSKIEIQKINHNLIGNSNDKANKIVNSSIEEKKLNPFIKKDKTNIWLDTSNYYQNTTIKSTNQSQLSCSPK